MARVGYDDDSDVGDESMVDGVEDDDVEDEDDGADAACFVSSCSEVSSASLRALQRPL